MSQPQPEHAITAEAPRERPAGADTLQERPVGRARSGAVTGVAVANFLLGILEIVQGVFLLVGAGVFGSAGRLPGAPAEFRQAAGVLAALAVMLAVVSILMGLLMELAGWGLLARRPWARSLTLVLGGLAVLAALASLNPLNPLSLILNAGYAALVFVVLLNPRYTAEFSPASAAADATRPGAAPERGLRLEWPLALLVLAALGLGYALGWAFSRPTSGSRHAGPRPLVAIMAESTMPGENVGELASQLARSEKLRVLDPSLVSRGPAGAPADLQMQARQLGADLMVVITFMPQHGTTRLKVVEVKTGVLLASVEDKSSVQLRSFVESAAEKQGR
jgi:hypothetical protein